MKRIFLSLCVSALYVSVLSARTISGTVLSAIDSTAVAGASCALTAADKLLARPTTASDGSFSITTASRDALTLEVSKAGFSPTSIIVENGSKNLDLSAIFLNEGVTLQEVTVTGNAVTHTNSRIIVYPGESEVRASSTSVSLFQKLPLPGLMADPINRVITVDGGNPVILINGVPSSMTDVNALQPKDIEKVEYSRFTPARYADKGNSGLVSITLKQRKDGGQVYLWARSALTTAFMDANLYTSYHQGPSQFTITYNPTWRNYQKVYDESKQSYIGDDYRVDLEGSDRNPFNYYRHPVQLKYDYAPDIRTLLTARFNISPSYSKRRVIGHSYDSRSGEFDYYNKSTSRDLDPSLDLFLRRDFNESNSLEVQVVGTLSSGDYRRSNRYMYQDGRDETYTTDADSRRRSLISEVSYNHVFSDRTSLSAGVQNTVSHSTNKYLDTDYKPTLTENNNYIYAQLGQRVGKVFMNLSTGAKLFWIKNDDVHRHFIRNLSGARIYWNISEAWNVYGFFNYTPSIPSLSALTDYEQQTSPYLAANGNPHLKSSENFGYAAGVDYTYRKFMASIQATYGTTHNATVSDVRYIGKGLFLSQTVNARYSEYYQASMSMRIYDVLGFGANVSLNLTHYKNAGSGWRNSLTSFSSYFSLWWNKGPYTISYWRKIPGKYLSGHSVGKDENGDALQVEYKPDKHWTLGVSWTYMFDKKGTRYPSWNYSAVNPSTSRRWIENNANMVVLQVNYTADFGSIFRPGRRNLNNKDTDSSLLKL